MNKILLLEDDLSLIDRLTYSLNKQGFDLDIAWKVPAVGRCGRFRRCRLFF